VLCASVLVAANARKPDSVTLTLAAPTGTTTVRCDELRLKQVLVNLVENAIKYSGAGSSVSVETRVTGAGVSVSVVDDGPGIPDSALPNIFDRFFRVDRSRAQEAGGSGLGLAITREIAEAHSGRVEVESHVPGGSRFTLTLPGS
jgi:two-component system phosphate regulon sensor histidine kinase PhoR